MQTSHHQAGHCTNIVAHEEMAPMPHHAAQSRVSLELLLQTAHETGNGSIPPAMQAQSYALGCAVRVQPARRPQSAAADTSSRSIQALRVCQLTVVTLQHLWTGETPGVRYRPSTYPEKHRPQLS